MVDHIYNNRKRNKHIWKKAEVDGWLAIWLKAVKYNNWPTRVAKYIWGKQSPDISCGSMETSNCKPLSNNCCKHQKSLYQLTPARAHANTAQISYARTARSKHRASSFTGQQRGFTTRPRHCTSSSRIWPSKTLWVLVTSWLTGMGPATQIPRSMSHLFLGHRVGWLAQSSVQPPEAQLLGLLWERCLVSSASLKQLQEAGEEVVIPQ